MNKLQLKILIMSVSVGISVIAWCQAIEFLVKHQNSQFDTVYLGYSVLGFLVLSILAFGMIKPPKNPTNSKFPIIITLFAIISICFLSLYNPLFECLRNGNTWQYAKGCIIQSDNQ